MVHQNIIDPFFRSLYKVLTEAIDDRMISLADGGVSSWDEYLAAVSYLRALKDVIDRCWEIEKERYGETSRKEIDELSS